LVTDWAPWPPAPDAVGTAVLLPDGAAALLDAALPDAADELELELELHPAAASAAAASAATA
jgi:hypothetical protein